MTDQRFTFVNYSFFPPAPNQNTSYSSSSAEEHENGDCNEEEEPEVTARSSASSSDTRSPAKPKHRREITMELIKDCFDLPEDQAAKKLRVSKTHLKRLCREFNIRRWPYRRLKSFSARIEKAEKTISDKSSTDSEKQAAQQEIIELEKRKSFLKDNPSVITEAINETPKMKVKIDHLDIKSIPTTTAIFDTNRQIVNPTTMLPAVQQIKEQMFVGNNLNYGGMQYQIPQNQNLLKQQQFQTSYKPIQQLQNPTTQYSQQFQYTDPLIQFKDQNQAFTSENAQHFQYLAGLGSALRDNNLSMDLNGQYDMIAGTFPNQAQSHMRDASQLEDFKQQEIIMRQDLMNNNNYKQPFGNAGFNLHEMNINSQSLDLNERRLSNSSSTLYNPTLKNDAILFQNATPQQTQQQQQFLQPQFSQPSNYQLNSFPESLHLPPAMNRGFQTLQSKNLNNRLNLNEDNNDYNQKTKFPQQQSFQFEFDPSGNSGPSSLYQQQPAIFENNNNNNLNNFSNFSLPPQQQQLKDFQRSSQFTLANENNNNNNVFLRNEQ